uniref:Uncharacterized protein n=1 Tax=Oryza nivara TaxID=4536 RepID=A0A0E0G049_ORYNI
MQQTPIRAQFTPQKETEADQAYPPSQGSVGTPSQKTPRSPSSPPPPMRNSSTGSPPPSISRGGCGRSGLGFGDSRSSSASERSGKNWGFGDETFADCTLDITGRKEDDESVMTGRALL